MKISRIFLPISSVRFLLARPQLWWLVATPAAISSVLMVVLMWAAYAFGITEVGQWVEPTSDSWWANVGADLAVAAGAIVLFAASIIATWVLASLIAGPFCDVLGERIEHELLASRPDLIAPPLPLTDSLIHTLRETVRRVLVATPIVLVGIMLEFIPFVGILLAPLVTIPSLLMFLSLDAFSYPLDRRSVPMRKKIDFIRTNRKCVIPLSVGLIPFTFPLCCPPLILPPIAAIAATRLYCELLLQRPTTPAVTAAAIALAPSTPAPVEPPPQAESQPETGATDTAPGADSEGE